MSKIGKWSTTAANNNAATPDGWPEGQAPSTVNDCAREMMAGIKTYVNDAQYIDLDNTPSFLTTTTFSMATADATNFHIGRRLKLFDTTTLYGTINSISSTFVSVRLDSGILSTSLSSVALAVVTNTNPSLPEHVYKRKNLIINGQFDIWQRSASFQLSASSGAMYTADRFAIYLSSTAQITITRSERSANASNVPTLAQCGAFLTNSLLVSVSAADAAIAAGEYFIISTKIEGYDWRQIAHKPNMLSFWVQSDTTGTYCIAARNSNNGRSFVQEYSISSVSTWEKKTIQIPEAPTAGTWDYSTGSGIEVIWSLMVGTTYHGGAGNWTAANLLATSNQTNLAASAGQTWAITGIQLEEGSVATPLEIKPIQQEFAACLRYYQKKTLQGTGLAFGVANAAFRIPLAQTMRASPTVTLPAFANLSITDGNGVAKSVSASANISGLPYSIAFDLIPAGTPFTSGQASVLSSTDDTTLDAEL